LASGSYDKTIRIWNIDTGVTIKVLTGNSIYINTLAVLPKGVLVSGDGNGGIKYWNVANGTATKTISFAHSGYINSNFNFIFNCFKNK